jgi:hypothetical protein
MIATAFVSGASLIICMNIFVIEKCGLLTDNNLIYMTAFAAGTLLGDAVLHIVPEMKEGTIYNVLIGVGVLVFFLIE